MIPQAATMIPVVERWRCVELEFQAPRLYGDPLRDVRIDAHFVGPRGQRLTRPAFWDGGNLWKVRFAPTEVGLWRWRLDGLAGQSGKVLCEAYRGKLPLYRHGFLSVSADGRRLAHADGTPFLWLADTHWLWESEPMRGAFLTMAEKRVRQGFSVYQVELFQRWKDGVPDVVHFRDNIDPKWRYLADRGLVVAVTHGLIERPASAKTAEREAQMARYVCARYGAYPAAWLMFQECTGHYAQWFNAPAERDAFMDTTRAVGRAYKAADAYHQPRTAHSDSPLLTAYRGEDWLDLTLLQGGHDTVIDRDRYYDLYFQPRRPSLPQIEGEADYEQLFDGAEPGSQAPITADDMREKAYQAMQCGCAGYSYGANGVWQAVLGPNDSDLHKVYGRTLWSRGIDLPGGDQLGHWKRFYASVGWERLQPRPECDGFATWDTALPPRARPAVAADADRTTIVVYFYRGAPTGGRLHHLHRVPYRARWFDPRTGAWTATRTVADDGRVPPKPDARDWLLVLDTAAFVDAKPVPFRWAQVQAARNAERGRNLAPKASATASSTDLVNKVYAPQHANDGKADPSDWHHWSSDAAQGLPASLTLTWPAPVTLRKIRLVFMRNYETADYELQARVGDGWKTLASVTGNTDTLREHTVSPPVATDALRFVGRRGPQRQPEIVRVVEIEAFP